MAADRPVAERGIVEIKMGRSKFPGKPSKIGNRKRVNLSSCSLPEENDSSKAAKNIYLGLSVFNETFGDNEMVAPGPFYGFSLTEVEEAMAEARLQQKEAEDEHKRQGIAINLWTDFQTELFSITSCSAYNHLSNSEEVDVNKTKLSFDGGGTSTPPGLTADICDNSDNQPSKTLISRNLENCILKDYSNAPKRGIKKAVQFKSPQLKLNKLQCSPRSKRSLQSQAAKKLLYKAKMSNLTESNKNCAADKKYILPSHSLHSSRVVMPSRRFNEDNAGKRKYLRSSTKLCQNSDGLNTSEEVLSQKQLQNIEDNNVKKKHLRRNESSVVKPNLSKNLKKSATNSTLSSGKIILREARLQLVKTDASVLEGPFSTPSSSSLSPNSQLKINPMQSVTVPGSIVCGVCGIVRFYKHVEEAKKFGIYCCEICQKFISKIMKSSDSKSDSKLHCLKGNGLCGISSAAKNQHFNAIGLTNQTKCEACWLKLCLQNFKMPVKLKEKLLKQLPVSIQMSINLELNQTSMKELANKFMLNNTKIKDFKWLNENSVHCQNKLTENKVTSWPNSTDLNSSDEKSCRKRTRKVGSENMVTSLVQNGKLKTYADDKNRQSIILKGPRVKHVCRSASVVLGQPLATFSSDTSPSKKQSNLVEDCNHCDNAITTNANSDTQEFSNKSIATTESAEAKPINREKKLPNPKEVTNSKAGKNMQQAAATKSKKKVNSNVENPVSMDFWESYDPEEICETGFGLIGSEAFSVRALCFLCGSSGHEKLIHCASCCEPYHEFCVEENQHKLEDSSWKFDWICPRCTVCFTCGKTSGQQLTCVKCDNSYHIECVDRVGGRLLHSPDRPWVCSVCLRCKSCNGVDVSVFVGNLPLCKSCFVLRQKGNYCPLCQRCYEDDDYDSKMMECGQCKCWVHAKCEGLSDEKYQVLSFLPESVEYVCRMCCVIPPAPWWVAVEAELKSGYLGVLKALSKNRKACTMLKWSPRKQCTCRQIGFVSRALDFEETKCSKGAENESKSPEDNSKVDKVAEETKSDVGTEREVKYRTASVSERKTSIEVISHPTESLKLTLKIMKDANADAKEKSQVSDVVKCEPQTTRLSDKCNDNKGNKVRVKKCPSNDENSEDSLTSTFDCQEENQTSLHSHYKGIALGVHSTDLPEKRSLTSPLNPASDSGIGSTDDELKANNLTDEECCKSDEQHSTRVTDPKSNCDTSVSFLEEKRECFCFLEVDSYNSRSKPFSPNLMSIKKKVTTSEYSSLHQFHQDMERMIATTHSLELMDLYHQTIKDIFPWFDPKFSRVQNSSQKITGTMSLESTPAKNTPVKSSSREECKILKEKLIGQPVDYFYTNFTLEDTRMCLLCKSLGDGLPGDTGRLLYCGQNEWVHCNCALWSGEVFEEIDGSLQNVHSAINRGRSIRCPECNLKGASIGCCARNCQETYHFGCARKVGCTFMDDKTMYCPAHVRESIGKLVQNEKEFEIRRSIYVELDKRKMKSADSNDIRFVVGALQVNSLGRFVSKLSDQEDAIVPELFSCSRWFWSCYEPWRLVRYHFSIRLDESQNCEGVDYGVNLTIDHSLDSNLLDLKLKQLTHFQIHNTLLDVGDEMEKENRKDRLGDLKSPEDRSKIATETCAKKSKNDKKVARKIFEQVDSKDDENCLSDNQNTAALLPPDIEEAIFRDLPHDILDGISMQDIFMDIKNDPYENGSKDGATDDLCEGDDLDNSPRKEKKNDTHVDGDNQNEFWEEANDCRQEVLNEPLTVSKPVKDLKKPKLEDSPAQSIKKVATLKTYQKSSNTNWNHNAFNNKCKKNSKCHVTVNLLEPQERGNMLQELKFTDGMVTLSTGVIGSIKDLRSRLEDNKRVINEEGKENKFLSWQARLQPRLLQVDGGVDSSSSGSEAGESPQRVPEETINSNRMSSAQMLPFLDPLPYSPGISKYPEQDINNFTSEYAGASTNGIHHTVRNLPQLDGVEDGQSDANDSDDSTHLEDSRMWKRRRFDYTKPTKSSASIAEFKINQCDGGVDSEYEEEDLAKCAWGDDLPSYVTSNRTEDEPVKCGKCHCTYRTKISYQRHLDSCSTDFMLSSSEAEMSDEESPKKKTSDHATSPTTQNIKIVNGTTGSLSPAKKLKESVLPANEKSEVKKEKVAKKPYTRKKATVQSTKKSLTTHTVPQVQQIVVQQQNSTPTIIVQDMGTPNVVPTTFTSSAMGYVAAVDAQNPFGKTHLIAAPNGLISGNFQFPTAPETQLLGGLCLNTQSVQPNTSGFIIQPPQTTAASLIPSAAGPVMMAGDQMMLGTNGLYADPRTGGMFLTSYNQPVFYNMETIVSNTVMQTNQFVSNVLATSYSQTSTQIFQTSEMEQMVSLPSNCIVIGANPPQATNRFISTDELICVQTPQAFLTNQNPLQIPNQSVYGSALQPLQALNAEPKIVSTQMSSMRCLQPVGPSVILGKIGGAGGTLINQPVTPIMQKPVQPLVAVQTSPQFKSVAATTNKTIVINQDLGGITPKKATVAKPQEKAVVGSKVSTVQPRSRALVDYINNFKSDICDTLSPGESVTETPVQVPVPVPVSVCISPTKASVSSAKPKKCATVSPQNVPLTPRPPVYNCHLITKNELQSSTPVTPVQPSSKRKSSPVRGETTEIAARSPTKPAEVKISLTAPAKIPPPSPVKMTLAISTDWPQKDTNSPNKSDRSRHSTLENEPSSRGDDHPDHSKQISPKVLTNKTNSYNVEKDVTKCLNMPSLDDDFPPCDVEPAKLNSDSTSPRQKTEEMLPLQENTSINGGCPKNSHPMSKASVNETAIFGSTAREKTKCKRKLNPNDQNTLNSSYQPDKTSESKAQEKSKPARKVPFAKAYEEKGPKLIFDVTSDDGFKSSSTSMAELWANICDSVQEMRATVKIPLLPVSRKGYEVLGMQNHGLQHCLEQLRGVEQCLKYKCKYFARDGPEKDEEEDAKENLSGCARTEQFTGRKEYDMFAWLASKHRKLPKLAESAEETLSSIRRANNLPLAMKYRNLRETAKMYLGVYRSNIHGRGLFCLREIEAGEMVIEYAGEVIRSNLTDMREKYYTEKGIGCYMFRIDDHFVVDATMKGNAARFINHSCEPNCYSKVVDILGKKHIVIFALRRINVMEELTYDYKFPFEDEKISCHCLSKKCKKYLN